MAGINIDKLSFTVVNALNAYRDVTVKVMRYAVDETAKHVVQDIKTEIASSFNGTGEYMRSWRYKRDYGLKGKWRGSAVVYAEAPYYRLTHLLENGHANVDGGRTEGRKHISPAAEAAEKYLTDYIRAGMEKG